MQLPSHPSSPPRRIDLLGQTAPAALVPWPVRLVADRSGPAAVRAFTGTVVDVPDRPSPEALDALGDLLRSGTRVQLRVFATWDEGECEESTEVLRSLIAASEEVLVGSRAHLVHLASRGVFADAKAVRIAPPEAEFEAAGPGAGVLDCRLDREPLPGVDAVARDRDAFERGLLGCGTVLVAHGRPMGGSALIDGLLRAGYSVVASGAAACGLEGGPRPRLVLLEEGAEWDGGLRAA